MDGQPRAGDLKSPPHNEIKGLISMTVRCSVTVCTEEYMALIGLAMCPLREQGQTGSVPSVPLRG